MELSKGFTNEVIEARENRKLSTSIKQTVATHPLKSGGSSFRTHKLTRPTPWKYAFKPTIGGIIFASLFASVGFGIIIYNLSGLLLKEETLANINWFLVVFGSIFATAGSLILYSFSKPRVFDKKANSYYTSYKKPLRNRSISKNKLPLNEIIALQIIGEHVKSEDSTYKSFELNIVVSDGTRRNVVDHGNLKSIIRDAQELEAFLQVPIWHSSSHLDN